MENWKPAMETDYLTTPESLEAALRYLERRGRFEIDKDRRLLFGLVALEAALCLLLAGQLM